MNAPRLLSYHHDYQGSKVPSYLILDQTVRGIENQQATTVCAIDCNDEPESQWANHHKSKWHELRPHFKSTQGVFPLHLLQFSQLDFARVSFCVSKSSASGYCYSNREKMDCGVLVWLVGLLGSSVSSRKSSGKSPSRSRVSLL